MKIYTVDFRAVDQFEEKSAMHWFRVEGLDRDDAYVNAEAVLPAILQKRGLAAPQITDVEFYTEWE